MPASIAVPVGNNGSMILPAPMLLHERQRTAVDEPGWIYELKFDGYRLIAGAKAGKVQLATKSGTDATRWYPEIVHGLSMLPGGPHVFDGEACTLDDLGRSDFNTFHDRSRRRRWYEGAPPVVYCAFDLLKRDGRDLMRLPVEERKRQLAEVLGAKPPNILLVGHLDAEHGPELFEHAKQLKLEGLVKKRLGSPYLPGERTRDWVKVRVPDSVPAERFKR